MSTVIRHSTVELENLSLGGNKRVYADSIIAGGTASVKSLGFTEIAAVQCLSDTIFSGDMGITNLSGKTITQGMILYTSLVDTDPVTIMSGSVIFYGN